MASPTLDLLCCSFLRIANDSNITDVVPAEDFVDENATVITPAEDRFARIKKYFYLYNSTVIAMSAISVLGAIYVLFPKRRQSAIPMTRPGLMEIRQRWILFWLSFADIMACLGLIVLSAESIHVLTISNNGFRKNLGSRSWEWVCILATAWIHFFFFSTYVWITCYAIDVYLFLRKSVKCFFKVYFLISWLFPLIFIAFGLWALYRTTEPVMTCSASDADYLLVVYYLCLFVPMVIVLVVNPILYFTAGKRVSPLMRGRGMYTDRERQIERQVRKKFLKIVVVMEICWLPNVLNGILLLSGVPFNMRIYSIIWILMAILNPLQAFLNTLVYWGPNGCTFLSFRRGTNEWEDSEHDILHSHPPWKNASVPSDAENQPLLRGRARDTLN